MIWKMYPFVCFLEVEKFSQTATFNNFLSYFKLIFLKIIVLLVL